MNEAFLWYLWRYRLFSHDLKTTDGETVVVEHPGFQNNDSGPDFFNARVRIGPTLWAGNVEVHVRASDWFRHHHQDDKAYDSVILHVVYEADAIVRRNNGEEIPLVVIRSPEHNALFSNYKRMVSEERSIPCSRLIKDVDELSLLNCMDRMLITRLERKAGVVYDCVKRLNENWEEAFYCRMAAAFGFKVNSVPFEMLAQAVPWMQLIKHHDVFQNEALLFGQAGLLAGTFRDAYPRKLRKEYIYLKRKSSLPEALEPHAWKLSRMRPGSFPFVRIAQFARLFSSHQALLSQVLHASHPDEVRKLLSVEAGDYWMEHYRFDRKSASCSKHLGAGAVESIIINTVVPFLFCYGRARRMQPVEEKALAWLENCQTENNRIIREWKSLGIVPLSAFQSQALIELKNEYCSRKNCLICDIGKKLLRTDGQYSREDKRLV